jgi:putative intracellular protease/amidase
MTRFKQDRLAQEALSQTIKLGDVKADDFDTVFYVGGHGPMWDLAESPVSIALIESFYNSGKPIALVCHSPGVLRHVTYKGEPLVKGKRLQGVSRPLCLRHLHLLLMLNQSAKGYVFRGQGHYGHGALVLDA